jgi:hypothetical protein
MILLFIMCLDYGANNGTNNDGTSNIGEYPGKCNPFLMTLSLLKWAGMEGALFIRDRVKILHRFYIPAAFLLAALDL